MAVNPSLSTYATRDAAANQAVVDVDIKEKGPKGETSGKAQVVVLGKEVGGAANGSSGTVEAVATPTDGVERGGAITTGNTSQQVMAANAARKGAWIQNQSSGDLYVRVGGAATLDQNSLRIAPAQLYEFPHAPVGAVNIVGATNGQVFAAKEW
jgi:hypothetical protein